MAFSGAHNFEIHNPILVDQSTNYTLVDQSTNYKSGIDILLESCAPEAAFDSNSRQYTPLCCPGTRSQYIDDILSWATAQSTFPMYRMTGPAGVGKSTIALTCAEKLGSQRQLGASFFFTIRGCSDHTRFFPSISFQLSSKSPDYHELLERKTRSDPTLAKKQLRSQFRELIVEPLSELEKEGKQIGRRAILIDGLDECNDKDAQREIIEIIITSVSTHTTPFYWAFFSRPEPQIEAAFADHRVASLCVSTSLSISRDADGEIELYLRRGLQDILRRRGITLSNPWPSEQDIYTLTSAAQGLYIYAATVLQFVGRMDTEYDPQELLRMLIKGSAKYSRRGVAGTPFKELDAFYTLILKRVPDRLRSSVLLLLSLVVLDHLDGEVQVRAGIRFASNALRFTEIQVKMLCGELTAVVSCIKSAGKLVAKRDLGSIGTASSVPPVPIEEIYAGDELLRFNHKSFFDYLCDSSRSGSFCVATRTMRNKLFRHLLELLLDYSKFYSFQSDKGLLLSASESDKKTTVSGTTHALSWPFDSELLNSSVRAVIFDHMNVLLLNRFFPYDDLDDKLLRKFRHVDHRRLLSIHLSWFLSPNIYIPGSNWGSHCVIKNVQRTVLCLITRRDMITFDVATFRRGVSRLERAKVIQRHRLSSTTLELPLFRYDSDGNTLSGLYIKGDSQTSTFWYWCLDPELKYYRDFETIDLAEGENIFMQEEFDLWPDREDARREREREKDD